MLKLQHYDLDEVHSPGKTNPADYISQHPCSTDAIPAMPETEIYINFIAQHVTPKAVSLDDIRAETARDPVLPATIQAYGTSSKAHIGQCGTSAVT